MKTKYQFEEEDNLFSSVSDALEILLKNNSNLKYNIKYLYSTYLLISSLTVIFLANRAIKKDQKLVSSLDRLR